jgi:uncharacterized protein
MKALLLSLILFAGACQAEEPQRSHAPGAQFPALTGRVVDEADLLPPASEAAIARQSAAVERETGAQYVVVTVPSLQGYAIEEYGVALARHWGIGSKERDDGVLLIVAPTEKRARIEVGYGLERRITDPYASTVMEEKIIPRFREGRFEKGIEDGAQAIAARLRSKASEAEIMKADGVVPW